MPTVPVSKLPKANDVNCQLLVWRRTMKRLQFLLAVAVTLLPGLLHSGSVLSAQATLAKPAVGQAPATGFVGEETCAQCHDVQAKSFPLNPHSKLAQTHGGKGVTCEGCHGAGQAHVEGGGDKTKIFSFKSAPAKAIQARCLSCHLGSHANFDRSAHSLAGVSCTTCHSSHTPGSAEHLLKVAQPQLCYSCHTDVKASFSQPFHHKVNEGVLQCTDCHNPHGTLQDKLLKTNADQNAVCSKCHVEKTGPFIHEHPPIKTEGCIACHTPHGSSNARLLTHNNVNQLCLSCHTASANFTTPGTPSFHNQANQYQSCLTCHTQIHGSNTNAFFFN